MYIADESQEDYDNRDVPNRYSWGWLGNKVPRNKCGWDDPQLKKRVIQHLKNVSNKKINEGVVVIHHMGHHDCEICVAAGTKIERSNTFNGSLVITHEGREFRCPAGVEHYIEEHDYNPGEKIIDALFSGKYFTWAEEEKSWRESLHKRLEKYEKQRPKPVVADKGLVVEWPVDNTVDPEVESIHKKGIDKLAQLRRDDAIVGG